tara:strand:+ start:204 stop:455 length:252 start_codon:yes stop_codon:yes gene_type:complete
MLDFDKMTRRFLLGEGKDLSIGSYIRALQDSLRRINPTSQSQAIVVENMRAHIRSVKREVLSLQEKVGRLEEKVQMLEENKEK